MPAKHRELLANTNYDNDASAVESDFESDIASSADENDGVYKGRTSVQDGDREVLEEAEEQEKLLHKPGRFDAVRETVWNGIHQKPTKRKPFRRSSQPRRDESSTMFEMEEGFKDNSSQSSFEIFDDDETLNWQEVQVKARRNRGKLAIIHVLIVSLFLGLAYGAYRASRGNVPKASTQMFWNGTHAFKPTTIYISLDGFRADFLNRDLTPAMRAFIESGVSPPYMLPSFPSVTFPNHFTLVTGLYPESHGIVSNQFWDPALQEMFYYTDVQVSMQPKWWNAEPIWVTAENQGVRTAVHMWPGSEAHIPNVEPTYLDKFNETEVLTRKVDRLLHWLDLPGDEDQAAGEKRPQLMLSYVPNVDADGHAYGPNSTEIRGTIADVDSMLTLLVEGLVVRNLTEIVNIVIVSDHGMATTSNDRLIQLDDMIDMSLIDHIDGWPLRGLRLKYPEHDVPILYDQLLKESKSRKTFDVYTRKTMPERYHFSNNERIAPLWIVPKTGWAIVEKHDFDVADAKLTGKIFAPKGLHGYDHEHPLMRAIFIARGPAFPHAPNSRLPVFQNIEVYNIVCESLGVKPHPNNGTLHLPLKVEGLHSDTDAPQVETPADLSDDENASTTANAQSASSAPAISPSSTSSQSTPESSATPNPNEPSDNGDQKPKTSWWDILHGQIQKAKDWAKQFIDYIKNNKPDSDDNADTS